MSFDSFRVCSEISDSEISEISFVVQARDRSEAVMLHTYASVLQQTILESKGWSFGRAGQGEEGSNVIAWQAARQQSNGILFISL